MPLLNRITTLLLCLSLAGSLSAAGPNAGLTPAATPPLPHLQEADDAVLGITWELIDWDNEARLNWNLYARENYWEQRFPGDLFNGIPYVIPVTITNIGDEDLTVGPIYSDEGNEPVFTTDPVVEQDDINLESDEEMVLEFILLAREPDEYEANMVIHTDDPDDEWVLIPLIAEVTEPPVIFVEPTRINADFDEDLEPQSFDITIDNEGDGNLQWRAAAYAEEDWEDFLRGEEVEEIPWMTIEPDEGIIAADDDPTIMVVTIDPGDLLGGEYFAVVAVMSNDPETPIVPIFCIVWVTGVPNIEVWPGGEEANEDEDEENDFIGFGEAYFREVDNELVRYPKRYDMVVENNGSDILQIDDIYTEDEGNREVFFANLEEPTVINPREEGVVPIWFSPEEEAHYESTLLVVCNDPDWDQHEDRDPYPVRVRGDGLPAPVLFVDPPGNDHFPANTDDMFDNGGVFADMRPNEDPVAFDFTIDNDGESELRWQARIVNGREDDDEEVAWLAAEPQEGVVEPDDNATNLALTIDPVEALGGRNLAIVWIESNDPATSAYPIYCTLYTTGVPNIEVWPGGWEANQDEDEENDFIDFGVAYFGFANDGPVVYPNRYDMIIQNTGTDALQIDDIRPAGDELWGIFYMDFDDLPVIRPDEQVVVPIWFAPEEVGEINGILLVSSNDPDWDPFEDQDPYPVRVRGVGAPWPIAVFDPDPDGDPEGYEFEFEVGPGNWQVDRELVVANVGESDLIWSIELAFEAENP